MYVVICVDDCLVRPVFCLRLDVCFVLLRDISRYFGDFDVIMGCRPCSRKLLSVLMFWCKFMSRCYICCVLLFRFDVCMCLTGRVQRTRAPLQSKFIL